ncbi:MAG: 30S ribosomal protein S25e [Sulfolobales archaeon]|nr:30S ribosomal protein S25e [Sulfolobales archaeon]MCX8186237.1 30S ribosomal protein S25e [Sulfolobales archaeon]MDW7969027.1 30S ribosomal protein S25e [Sulfolobales archaeon]
MGGGKGGKPLSIAEKRQKKAMEEQLKQQLRKSEQRDRKTQTTILDESLVDRASKEVSNLNIVTPYTLSSKLGVSIGIARSIIKELMNQGKLKLVSKSRRVIIATAT